MKLFPETILQIQLMDWIKVCHPEIEPYTFHFAGERKCSPQQGAILKRMGVKPGVADLFISVSRETYKGLWLELKVGNNKPTDAQKRFLALMIEQGYAAACTVGFDASKAFIETYLQGNG